jgi:16S rRNA (cytosine1402-N4)-methyltransferase
MRMDPTQALDAREIVAQWDQRRLARVLRDYGEERHAGRIARAIVRGRARAPIETTQQLVDVIAAAIPAPARFGGGHPAKRTFQALRIAVNDELEQLDRALPLAWDLLRGGAVLAAISFHSLEDRRVKGFMSELARGCICPPDLPVCACGRKAISPGLEELQHNPRSASARLRAARKLSGQSADRRGRARP